MGKPLVWGSWASGEGLLQVRFSYYHLKREQAKDGMPRRGWQHITVTAGNKDKNKDADTLLMFY